jgi:hypothetical protein
MFLPLPFLFFERNWLKFKTLTGKTRALNEVESTYTILMVK